MSQVSSILFRMSVLWNLKNSLDAGIEHYRNLLRQVRVFNVLLYLSLFLYVLFDFLRLLYESFYRPELREWVYSLSSLKWLFKVLEAFLRLFSSFWQSHKYKLYLLKFFILLWMPVKLPLLREFFQRPQ